METLTIKTPADVLSFIGHTLRHGGYETRTATESTEISRIIAEWQPDLAFLDLDLHGDLIDAFAARESDRVPLIAFTRTHSTATKIEAFTRGADDLIAIPFVLVMRRLVPCSAEATNTSPREMNATSLPLGETSNSVTSLVTSTGSTSRSRRSMGT